MIGPLLLAAALTCLAPDGARLELRNVLEPLPPPPVPGWGQAIRYVSERNDLVWVGVVMTTPARTFAWPRGRRIIVTLRDSSQVQDSVLIVSEPLETLRMRPTVLGSVPVLNGADLWCKPCPWGGSCVQVLAAFPPRAFPTGSLRDVVRVEIGGP